MDTSAASALSPSLPGSDDDRIAMMAAQGILDRGYGKPVQSIAANIAEDGGPVRYYAEVPKKAESTEAWLQSISRTGHANGPPRRMLGTIAKALTRRLLHHCLRQCGSCAPGSDRAPFDQEAISRAIDGSQSREILTQINDSLAQSLQNRLYSSRSCLLPTWRPTRALSLRRSIGAKAILQQAAR